MLQWLVLFFDCLAAKYYIDSAGNTSDHHTVGMCDPDTDLLLGLLCDLLHTVLDILHNPDHPNCYMLSRTDGRR